MIFVVGYPRSGTTLMRKILAQHAALHTIAETPALNAMLRDDPVTFMQQFPDPANMVYKCNAIQYDFETLAADSKYVFMVRDPRDCIMSYLELAPNALARPFDWYVATWGNYIERFATMPNTLHIRYEDLVANPRVTIAKILAFLGLPWQETLLLFRRSEDFDVPEDRAKWHPGLTKALYQNKVGFYHDRLTPEQNQSIQSLAPLLQIWGY